MMHLQHDIACCILVLFILSFAKADFQNYINLQHRALHLPEKKFGFSEYSEDTDNDEKDKGPLTQWNEIPVLYPNGRVPKITTDSEVHTSDAFDKNIVWDSHWAQNLKFGQISAVSIDPNGNIAIFHRGSRIWGISTFENNRFDPNKGPIQENTIILLDKFGKKLFEWGKDMFYLPHGLTIDSNGNYWITDVAMHQVFKFDAKDIALMRDAQKLEKRDNNGEATFSDNHNFNNLFENHVPKPSLILGEAFEPGNDDRRFCKPTAVAVQPNGDFFVSDGYCNSRIIKYNQKGEKILQWGRHWGSGGGNAYMRAPPPYAFLIPHALALANEYNLIFVADRENGRIVSFFAQNGTFHKEYKHPIIGTKIYSVAYAKDRLYLINGPDPNPNYNAHIRGFVLDVNAGNILSQFRPEHDMDRPHDIAVTENGSEIYVVELNKYTIYKFTQHINTTIQIGNSIVHSNSHHEPAPLRDNDSNDPSTGGCLLIMPKRMRWETERRENFKLSSLLEGRRGKSFKILEKRPNPRDFSKLNTEPETSEDEHPENSLTRVI
ncbi:peptidyl-alpha-hydroxyglycine alpha-amidating lyase 1 isoform X2 [Calliopsis andreniformis]|uniref:peptidyl-alpha-hydroxyglycine alpha-amidating lyase 1 isoform X2 n=1 Tax=Calliopsis andreniformis TaxID=337506 RepID=UPI003FCE3482